MPVTPDLTKVWIQIRTIFINCWLFIDKKSGRTPIDKQCNSTWFYWFVKISKLNQIIVALSAILKYYPYFRSFKGKNPQNRKPKNMASYWTVFNEIQDRWVFWNKKTWNWFNWIIGYWLNSVLASLIEYSRDLKSSCIRTLSPKCRSKTVALQLISSNA